MNDAPRRWWNRIDGSLRKYGTIPTRADRCLYVYYESNPKGEEKQPSKSKPTNPLQRTEDFSELIELHEQHA